MSKLRPKQHVIDQRACVLFDKSIPQDWVSRPLLSDYGVDKEVEIFENNKSTGLIFKVQIKGTRSPKFISNGSTITQLMSIRDIEYLCYELKIPTILVVVDVARETVRWHPIQIDADLRARLTQARLKGQNAVAVHISKENTLPKTWRFLFDKVLESETALAVRSFSSTSSNTFLNSVRSFENLDAVIADLGRNAALLRSAILARLWMQGDYAGVRAHVDSLLTSVSSSIEEKFEAYIYLNKLALFEASTQGSSREYGEISHLYATKLISITKCGPLHLRAFSILSLLAAKLQISARDDLHLFMNYQINRAPENAGFAEPLWAMMLPTARIRAAYLVVHRFQQCHRLLGFMFRNNLFSVIPRSIDLVISGMITFLLRLRKERMADAASLYERSLREMAEAAVKISLKLRNWEEASYLTLNGSLLCDPEGDQSKAFYRAWGIDLLQKIEDPAITASGLVQLDIQFEKLGEFSTRPDDEPEGEREEDLEGEKQIYIGMAKSLGIKMNDPNDMVAEIVNIGIDDLDPTRVLMNCRHLYLALGSSGMPARMLMLPTAGSKTLYCTLHKYGLASLSLDQIYESFKKSHCAECKNHNPQPAGWKWTRSWAREQYLKYKDRFRAL